MRALNVWKDAVIGKRRAFNEDVVLDEMSIPAPIPPIYQGLSGDKAVEAEEEFYCRWRFQVIIVTGDDWWDCLRTLAEDKVRASYAGIGVSAGRIC
ncbi:hypothetical protein GIB67_003204 [Kingdonia uniflora]|uniref:Uncharacterized protein n=1 Tax=Kingdonia uniflora TaxID=39325 RepID=A0A7J7LGT1_9MAGN|nr:hypothetical protein GIB67_003204 [Kingdonia uniflora]